MQIAAALLAGGFVFFAGFCLGLYPPDRHKNFAKAQGYTAQKDKIFENFLSYNGDIQP